MILINTMLNKEEAIQYIYTAWLHSYKIWKQLISGIRSQDSSNLFRGEWLGGGKEGLWSAAEDRFLDLGVS